MPNVVSMGLSNSKIESAQFLECPGLTRTTNISPPACTHRRLTIRFLQQTTSSVNRRFTVILLILDKELRVRSRH